MSRRKKLLITIIIGLSLFYPSISNASTTSLPLRVVAIHNGLSPLVIVEKKSNAGGGEQEVFSEGSSIFGLAKLVAIETNGISLQLADGTSFFLDFRAGAGKTKTAILQNIAAPRPETAGPETARPAFSYDAVINASLEPGTNAAEAIQEPSKKAILAFERIGERDLRILDRHELFSSMRNFSDFVQTYNPALVRTANGKMGVKISRVPENSIVEALGFKSSDTITAINGREFENATEAYGYVSKLSNDALMGISVERDGEKKDLHFASRHPEKMTDSTIAEVKAQVAALDGSEQLPAEAAIQQAAALSGEVFNPTAAN